MRKKKDMKEDAGVHPGGIGRRKMGWDKYSQNTLYIYMYEMLKEFKNEIK